MITRMRALAGATAFLALVVCVSGAAVSRAQSRTGPVGQPIPLAQLPADRSRQEGLRRDWPERLASWAAAVRGHEAGAFDVHVRMVAGLSRRELLALSEDLGALRDLVARLQAARERQGCRVADHLRPAHHGGIGGPAPAWDGGRTGSRVRQHESPAEARRGPARRRRVLRSTGAERHQSLRREFHPDPGRPPDRLRQLGHPLGVRPGPARSRASLARERCGGAALVRRHRRADASATLARRRAAPQRGRAGSGQGQVDPRGTHVGPSVDRQGGLVRCHADDGGWGTS